MTRNGHTALHLIAVSELNFSIYILRSMEPRGEVQEVQPREIEDVICDAVWNTEAQSHCKTTWSEGNIRSLPKHRTERCPHFLPWKVLLVQGWNAKENVQTGIS